MELNLPKAAKKPGRRREARRGLEREDEEVDRRLEERRDSLLRRQLVHFFRTHDLPTLADIMKTTKLIEPFITVLSFFVSGVANHALMGLAGVAVLIALVPHEFGHFQTTIRLGYKPKWFWFISIFGAIIRRTHVRSRSHEAHIAFGGPLYGCYFTALVGVAWFMSAFFTHGYVVRWQAGLDFLYTMAVISAILNLFNLIPIGPLDGGGVSQGMSGNWPKRMRLLGLILLIVATWLTGQTTMFVIWILAVGEVRWEFRGHVLNKKWRYIIAILIFVAMLAKLVSQWSAGGLSGLLLFAEVSYSSIAVWFLFVYYQQWKYPKKYKASYELRMRPVNQREGRLIFKNYWLLVVSLLLVLALLLLGKIYLS